MKNPLRYGALVLSLVLLLTLAACGGAPASSAQPGSNTSSPAAAGTGEVRTVKVMQFKGELTDTMVAMANAYNEEHEGIDLQIETVNADQYQTALKTRFASGEAPDVFNVEGFNQKDLWLEHLEDLSDQPWVANMVPSTVDGIMVDNKIYGLPLQIEGVGITYNTEMFAKAGITETPRTLTEFKAAMEKLKAAGLPGISNELFTSYTFGVFVVNIGVARQPDVAAFVDGLNKGTETFAGNPIFEEWLDFLDVLLEYSHTDPLQIDFGTQYADFAAEKAALLLGGNGPKTMLDEMNPNLPSDIFPIPMNDDAEANDVYYGGANCYWVVNKDSEVKDEAKEFLNWMVSSPTGQHYLCDVFQFIPGILGLPVNEEAIGNIGMGLNNYIKEGKMLGFEYPRYPAGATNEMGIACQEYYAGRLGRDELLQTFDTIWQQLAGE